MPDDTTPDYTADEVIAALPDFQRDFHREFFERAASKEELDPELAAYVDDAGPLGPMVRHPLVYDITGVNMPGLANDRLKYKKKRLAEAIEEKDWDTVVFLHERPYRCEALLQLEADHSGEISDADYWKLVGSVWIDSENIWQNTMEWDILLGSDRTGRENFMRSDEDDDDDIAGFNALPDVITVYRGCQEGTNEEGLSWTTDRERAVWFAKRFQEHRGEVPVLLTGTVAKSDVIGFLTGRNESEVVIEEGSVTVEKIEEV